MIGFFALLSAGFLIGVGGIATAQRRLGASRAPTRRRSPAPSRRLAMTPAELADHHRAFEMLDRRALRTAMVIAVAIGLHNFAEGLAIGVSAQAGEIGLATVLIIGFALHNSTEGFGIVGPLERRAPLVALAGPPPASSPEGRPSWARWSATRSPATRSSWASSPSRAARSSMSSARSGRACAARATPSSGSTCSGVGFLLGIATDLVVAYGGA